MAGAQKSFCAEYSTPGSAILVGMPNQDGRHRRGVFLAASGMLLVSLDSLGIRLADASSWDIAFWFGTFTFGAMLILVPLLSQKPLWRIIHEDGAPTVFSGFLQAASTTFFILAINSTTVSNTVVIVAAAPVLAAALAHYFIGERTPVRVWFAIVGSIAGILVVVSGSLEAGRIEGDLAAVAAILAFSANLTLWRRYPSVNRMAAVGLGGLAMAITALVPADPFGLGARAMLILVVLGGVAGPAGRISIASATRYLSTAQVSLFTPVETIAATTWAFLLLDESPPSTTVIGGIIVLAAVAYGASQKPVAPVTRADV